MLVLISWGPTLPYFWPKCVPGGRNPALLCEWSSSTPKPRLIGFFLFSMTEKFRSPSGHVYLSQICFFVQGTMHARSHLTCLGLFSVTSEGFCFHTVCLFKPPREEFCSPHHHVLSLPSDPITCSNYKAALWSLYCSLLKHGNSLQSVLGSKNILFPTCKLSAYAKF